MTEAPATREVTELTHQRLVGYLEAQRALMEQLLRAERALDRNKRAVLWPLLGLYVFLFFFVRPALSATLNVRILVTFGVLLGVAGIYFLVADIPSLMREGTRVREQAPAPPPELTESDLSKSLTDPLRMFRRIRNWHVFLDLLVLLAGAAFALYGLRIRGA